ncbi:MAG: hypothetical protein ACOCZE_13705 [Planctomycetota bacterium]
MRITILLPCLLSALVFAVGCGGPEQNALDSVRLGQAPPSDLPGRRVNFGWTALVASEPLPAADQVTVQRGLIGQTGRVVAIETLKVGKAHRGFWKSDSAEYTLEFTVEPGAMNAPPTGWSIPAYARNIERRAGMAILASENDSTSPGRTLEQVRDDVAPSAPANHLADQALRVRAMLAELPPVDVRSAAGQNRLRPLAQMLTRGPTDLLAGNRQAIAAALGGGEYEAEYENIEWTITKLGPNLIRIRWETGDVDAAFFGLEPG